MRSPCLNALLAEWLGTAFLLATVIGSGIMAERLAGGNVALALLCNTLPTGAILFVLITMLSPISGAHFNPAVTGVFVLKRELAARAAAAIIVAQCLRRTLRHACGTSDVRGTGVAALAEAAIRPGAVVFGMGRHLRPVTAILLTRRANPAAMPAVVGLYITAAYWFTASTSFANPAVTLARAFTDSFAGIRIPTRRPSLQRSSLALFAPFGCAGH